MKYFLSFFILLCCGCLTSKRPNIYPDLYQEKLISSNSRTINLFQSKKKSFWIYCFKAVATLSYKRNEIKSNDFKIERDYIGIKFEKIADSIGASSLKKYYNYIHFHDSEYLNDEAVLNYNLSKHSLTKLEREIIEAGKKNEH